MLAPSRGWGSDSYAKSKARQGKLRCRPGMREGEINKIIKRWGKIRANLAQEKDNKQEVLREQIYFLQFQAGFKSLLWVK